MLLFYDNETTDVWDKYLPTLHEGQPRVVQFAYLVTDDEGEEVAQFSSLIQPAGWEVKPGAEKAHGISTGRACAQGIPMNETLELFSLYVGKVRRLIAHNDDFDWKMIYREIALAYGEPACDVIRRPGRICTMRAAVDVCAIPPTWKMKMAGRLNFKSPTLAEAYEILFGEKLLGAHDAMVDVRACARIYFELVRRGIIPK